jgi:hypothetical protein
MAASLPPMARRELHRYACVLCARRKVKCDKGDPCANCLKTTDAQCLYEAPAPHRRRKRAGDEELLSRLASYEDLMRKHNIDFSHYANAWVPSALELTLRDGDPQIPVSVISAKSPLDEKTLAPEKTAANTEQWEPSSMQPPYNNILIVSSDVYGRT